jgi:hypothetical protein
VELRGDLAIAERLSAVCNRLRELDLT